MRVSIDSNYDKIRKIALELIDKHTTRDPFILAELLNIPVIKHNMKDFHGYHLRCKGQSYIIINSENNDDFQPFVVAHELGHALLHPSVNIASSENTNFAKLDKEANIFAAELLIEDDLSEYKDLTLSEIAEIKNVPIELLMLKLKYSE